MDLSFKEWFVFYWKSGSTFKKFRNQVSEIKNNVHPQFLFNLRLACDLFSYFITFVLIIPVGIFIIDHPTAWLRKPLFIMVGLIIFIMARLIANCFAASLLRKKYRKQ